MFIHEQMISLMIKVLVFLAVAETAADGPTCCSASRLQVHINKCVVCLEALQTLTSARQEAPTD